MIVAGKGDETMAFDTPNGTRGARQPGRSRIEQWANRMMVDRVRRKGSFDAAKSIVLVSIGSRTGAERRNPVAWFPAGDDTGLVVASASGAARNPSWYYNLAAHPDLAHIEVGGERIAVTAAQLHGAEREDAWRSITTRSPGFARYESITDRVMPVIRLTRRRDAER
ncbi:MAG: nitroreductase/quinone reductase family protein [Leifsonia sp.]